LDVSTDDQKLFFLGLEAHQIPSLLTAINGKQLASVLDFEVKLGKLPGFDYTMGVAIIPNTLSLDGTIIENPYSVGSETDPFVATSKAARYLPVAEGVAIEFAAKGGTAIESYTLVPQWPVGVATSCRETGFGIPGWKLAIFCLFETVPTSSSIPLTISGHVEFTGHGYTYPLY
jgi:hypothetical protein